MKFLNFTDTPAILYGIGKVDPEKGIFHRLPDEVSALVSGDVRGRSKTPAGGRIRFSTNSKNISVRVQTYSNTPDENIPLTGSVGVDIYIGSGVECRYLGNVAPSTYDVTEFEASYDLDCGENEVVTINLLRNHNLKALYLGVDDDAEIFSPKNYSLDGRICYYGSSITEGGCASRPGNAYASIVSRRLDIDYVNYGFSGSARGEIPMADIISDGNFRIIVMDYDYNAPSVEHLRNTHAPFFKRLREKNPSTPIVMISRPNFEINVPESIERRDIILSTYASAVAQGDKNAYFIDGETLFGERGRECCLVDVVHPGDLGHMKMADRIYPVLKRIIDKENNI